MRNFATDGIPQRDEEVDAVDVSKGVEFHEFDTMVIYSIASGYLLCPFNDMHRDIELLCGFPVWTHQMPRVFKDLQPKLIAALPWLSIATAHAEDGQFKDESYRNAWSNAIKETHGDKQTLQIPLPSCEFVDPLTDIPAGKEVITVAL